MKLSALKKAFQKVIALGYVEREIQIGSQIFRLRNLQKQEGESVLADNQHLLVEGDGQDTIKYLTSFRLGVLSHAIIGVDDLDFRDVKFVETDEKLPNGVTVKIAKPQAILQLLKEMNADVQSKLYDHLVSLEAESSRMIREDLQDAPSDMDIEIIRLRERLEALEAQKADNQALAQSSFKSSLDIINEAMGNLGVEPPSVEEPPLSGPEPPQPPPVDVFVGETASQEPVDHVPSPVDSEPTRTPTYPQDLPPMGIQGIPEETAAHVPPVKPPREDRGSFGDPKDSAQIEEARRQAQALREQRPKNQALASGVPVYRMDTQELSPLTPTGSSSVSPLNAPQEGSRNPRFRKPQ